MDLSKEKKRRSSWSESRRKNYEDRYRKRFYIIIEKIVKNKDECWVWEKCVNNKGYGLYGTNSTKGRKSRLVHRILWEFNNGPIPEGMCVLHKCDNPPCCNPYHLFLGTKKDNAQDKSIKNRMPKGEECTYSKLKEKEVLSIREDTRTQAIIAKDYNICQMQVCRIKNKIQWSWL